MGVGQGEEYHSPSLPEGRLEKNPVTSGPKQSQSSKRCGHQARETEGPSGRGGEHTCSVATFQISPPCLWRMNPWGHFTPQPLEQSSYPTAQFTNMSTFSRGLPTIQRLRTKPPRNGLIYLSANICWIIENAREFQKNMYFCFSDYAKDFDCVENNKVWEILKEMGILDYLSCLLRNLYAGQEATVRTRHGTMAWFQIGKEVLQGCILSPCLFNLYTKDIMRNARLDEAQAGIKTARRDINNLRYTDDNQPCGRK